MPTIRFGAAHNGIDMPAGHVPLTAPQELRKYRMATDRGKGSQTLWDGRNGLYPDQHHRSKEPTWQATTSPRSQATRLIPCTWGLSREWALQQAHAALDGVQRAEPEIQVMAVAILFDTMARHIGLDPHDLCEKAARIDRDEDFHRKANSIAQTLRDYISIRIIGRMTTFS